LKQEHIGSDFDDFLREERLLEISEATAAERVIAFPIAPDEAVQADQVGDGQRQLKP
jgi:hypothetical protein